MSIQALKALTEDWFTPTSQEDSPTPARFKIRPLSGTEHIDCLGLNGYDRNKVLQYGLKDWENISDPLTNDALKFSQLKFGSVPPLILTEIAGEIISRSEFTGEQEKNL